MKVKVTRKPKMGAGGSVPLNNIANPIPFPSLFNINPFGIISTNNTNTSDDSITTTLRPIDRSHANVEAEKGEMLIKGDLTGLYKIGGKKHSEGGTPLHAQHGAFIYSDDKDLAFTKEEKSAFNFKMGTSETKRNNTPAKVLKREVDPEDYNKMVTILQDPKSSDIAKNTAALMLQKYQQKAGQVALVQEAKKARATIPPFATGPTELSTGQREAIKDGAERMYAKKGGFVYDDGGKYPPDKTGKWAGDFTKTKNPKTGLTSNSWNAMTDYDSPEAYANAVGYPDKVDTTPSGIQKLQQWVIQKYPDVVKKYHSPTQYGMPAEGRPDDGKLGVRWNAIGQDIERQRTPNPVPVQGPTTMPRTINPITASPLAGTPQNAEPIVQDQWQGYKFGMNPLEKLTTVAPFLTALSQKPYYDMLVQRSSPTLRLDRMDPTQEASNIQQASSLAQREAAQNLPGKNGVAVGAQAQARATSAVDNLFHQINERNQQIGNQESEINLQNKLRDQDFNLGQAQQTYRNNLLTQQRRQEQLANAATQSLNNGVQIANRLDAMGLAATQAALPYMTGAKDQSGNPLYYTGADGKVHQQVGVPIGFNADRRPLFNPQFGGLDSVGVSQASQNMVGRNFNNLLMGQITDALNDKTPEGTKRLYTLLLGLDRSNKPNTKGDTPLENIIQAARSSYYGQ